MGLTFKENCPDTRNTKVIDIINELKDYGVEVLVYDPVADKDEAFEEYELKFNTLEDLKEVDAIICAVAHEEFKSISLECLTSMYSEGKKVLIDIKGLYNRKESEEKGILYWRL